MICVQPHLLPVSIAERARLAPDTGGDAHAPHIVQQCRTAERGDIGPRQPAVARRTLHELCHTRRMSQQERCLDIDKVGDSCAGRVKLGIVPPFVTFLGTLL